MVKRSQHVKCSSENADDIGYYSKNRIEKGHIGSDSGYCRTTTSR